MKNVAVYLGLALLAAACASNKPTEAPVTERGGTTTPSGTAGTGSTTTPAPTTEVTGNPLHDPNNILSKRSVYFDFDSNVVKDEYRGLIQAHARYMTEHADTRARIEGNCDERGSREYNLALGQRRAEAVKKIMSVLGVSGWTHRDHQLRRGEAGRPGPRRGGLGEEPPCRHQVRGRIARAPRRGAAARLLARVALAAAGGPRARASSTTTRPAAAWTRSTGARAAGQGQRGPHREARGADPQHRRGGGPAADRAAERGDRAAARAARGARQREPADPEAAARFLPGPRFAPQAARGDGRRSAVRRGAFDRCALRVRAVAGRFRGAAARGLAAAGGRIRPAVAHRRAPLLEARTRRAR